MYVIGHRGCMDQYPENTVRAVRESAPHVDAVEVDVQRCGSGELVVFHDESLDRITGAEGIVSETPWSELSELEVHDTGEPIPRFTDVVAAWPGELDMNLDVHQPNVAPDALDALWEFEGEILLSSTNPTVLEEAAGSDVDVTRGYSFYEDVTTSMERADELGCDFLHVYAGLCLETDLVERAHDDDFKIDAWTVDDEATAKRLTDARVDAMTVDRWDLV